MKSHSTKAAVGAGSSDSALAEAIAVLAVEAGRIILDLRGSMGPAERKADHSPVTEADRAAEAAITAGLAELAPGVPVVGEEAVSAGRIPETGAAFFLVDPLDGTREFIRGGDDFTVNVGLIRNGAPVLGVIFVPVSGALYVGIVGEGAWQARVRKGVTGPRQPIHVRRAPQGPIDVVASRSHRTKETDTCIARYRVGKLVAAGSSLKFCVVAAGEADLYPRLGTTMQWDTAAGDAILRAAGGQVVTLEGAPLPYGPNGRQGAAAFENPWFIAAGGIKPLPLEGLGGLAPQG
ncbi:3'(2'),5'-bisphosphate nucleotidase CysQ [soil metagenome]